ncbi:MAG: glycerophosphodiester phosphodiesterase family protein [Tepidamorphaceae bacterium]|nr:glycerophosphodiester phosphodiesterase [Rhodobiaceae bacterium]MCC0048789.1 glycerophosphodiester phosphodiesterase [Rhodobiaceae bacterium]
MRAPDWIGKLPVAHRGLHDVLAGRIENTLSAVRAAVDAGFAIEIDVQMSADGKVMVFHDTLLDRLTSEKGRMDARTSIELGGIRVSATSDTIPTLSEVLAAIDGKVPLYIELKHEGPTDWALERAVIADLENYDGPVAAMSFEPSSIAVLRRLAPELPRGIVSEGYHDTAEWSGLNAWQRFYCRHLLHFFSTLPHFIAYKVQDLPAPAPVMLNTVLAMPLLAWTVHTKADVERAKLTGAQMIFEGFRP